MITEQSPIVGQGGSIAEARAALVGLSQTDNDYINELYRLCQLTRLDFRILFSQFLVETADGTSSWWKTRRNPAGIGITGDKTQDDASPTWANGTDAARAQIVHMLAYANNPKANGAIASIVHDYKHLDPRYDLAYQAYGGTVKTLGDLGDGKWAVDKTYAAQIAAKAQKIFKETGMAQYAVAGLATKITLSFPLIQSIIPAGQTNQRPGIKLTAPLYWVQHETANVSPGADAAMHARYLLNGADGSQVSWHFTVDDHQAYQHIPIDEVTWQAADGSGPGNMNGESCEMCVNADGNETQARHNTEELCAAICVATGVPIANVKRHYDFNAGDPNRHHCPDHMMTQNYWPTFVANVGKRMGGPVVAEPFAIPWEPGAVGVQTIGTSKALALKGEVTARRNVPLRQSADSKSPVVHNMKQGETGVIVGTYRDPKTARRWAFVEYQDGKVGRCLLSALTPPFPTL